MNKRRLAFTIYIFLFLLNINFKTRKLTKGDLLSQYMFSLVFWTLILRQEKWTINKMSLAFPIYIFFFLLNINFKTRKLTNGDLLSHYIFSLVFWTLKFKTKINKIGMIINKWRLAFPIYETFLTFYFASFYPFGFRCNIYQPVLKFRCFLFFSSILNLRFMKPNKRNITFLIYETSCSLFSCILFFWTLF